ncbi:MAG TPA: HAD-IB family hydrolase [Acidimicrobiales bacterium]|nr:HAD-IB family hydrolase [Acidimicrobiales bacterium]
MSIVPSCRSFIIGPMVAVLGRTDPLTRRSPAAMGLAVFDLDRTLVPGSSLAVFGRELVASGLVARRDVARFGLVELAFRRGAAGDSSLERLCRSLLHLASGRDYQPLLDVAARVAPGIASRAYAEGRALVDRHRRAGDLTVLLSAAPHDLVAAVGAALGFDASVGTAIEIEGGRCTGRLASVFCYGPGKLERLRELVADDDIARAAAYADSGSDLHLLRRVAKPVAVNPDRRLAAEAVQAGWPRLRFT